MRLTLLLLALLAVVLGQDASAPHQWSVVHQRTLWPDSIGTLTLDSEGLRFSPARDKDGKPKALSLGWNQIQQLTLTESSLEIVTYQDVLWQVGRDRQFRFQRDKSAEGNGFAQAAESLREHLGSRLVIALGPPADPATVARWRIPAKRLGLLRGVDGSLVFLPGELFFQTEKPGESRRWPLSDIQTIAQTSPYSLTLTAPERALTDQGGFRSFSFQLKQPLGDAQYQQLWRAIERAHGTRLRFHSNTIHPDATDN
jgi:hypothetical protein